MAVRSGWFNRAPDQVMRFETAAISAESAKGQAHSRTLRDLGCRGLPSQAAFTLAEMLAALVFMAVLIPVAMEGLSVASRAGEVAARKGEAALIAERILNENIVTTNWGTAYQSGTVRQHGQDFKWTLRTDAWNQDPVQSQMQLLSVE